MQIPNILTKNVQRIDFIGNVCVAMYKHNNGPATAAIVAAALAAASVARLTIQAARKTCSISLSNYFIRKSQWEQQQKKIK